jgi:hypothetical protein
MRYLCLGYHDEKAWSDMSDRERDQLIDESFAYERELRAGGHYIDGIALQSVRSAATLRFINGQTLITDGPFAETKEQLGGVLLIEARDLNHAIQLMSQTPCMRLGGSLEIRPLNEELTDSSGVVQQAVPAVASESLA